MSNDIKIGSTVRLLHCKRLRDFVITDIFFERYIADYKTVIKAKYYSEYSDCWFMNTYYANDFFEAMNKAKEITDKKEADND